MRCFFCFQVSYDKDHLDSPEINSYYGPVIKEDKEYVVIENHAENSTIFHNSHFGKIGMGKAIFDSPSDVINANQLKQLNPHYNSFPVDDEEILEVYMIGFFFEDNEGIVKHIAAKLCKKACLNEYQQEAKRKIEELQENLSWTKKLMNRKMNKF